MFMIVYPFISFIFELRNLHSGSQITSLNSYVQNLMQPTGTSLPTYMPWNGKIYIIYPFLSGPFFKDHLLQSQEGKFPENEKNPLPNFRGVRHQSVPLLRGDFVAFRFRIGSPRQMFQNLK